MRRQGQPALSISARSHITIPFPFPKQRPLPLSSFTEKVRSHYAVPNEMERGIESLMGSCQ